MIKEDILEMIGSIKTTRSRCLTSVMLLLLMLLLPQALQSSPLQDFREVDRYSNSSSVIRSHQSSMGSRTQ